MIRLFVDPGTKSVGFAVYSKQKLLSSFTVTAIKSDSAFLRMSNIVDQLFEKLDKLGIDYIDESHLEQLVRNTHIAVHWSVGAIGTALAYISRSVEADIPIQSWKLFQRSEKGSILERKYRSRVESNDEMCAILFGAYYVNNIKKEDL